jgi:hypothetical protein
MYKKVYKLSQNKMKSTKNFEALLTMIIVVVLFCLVILCSVGCGGSSYSPVSENNDTGSTCVLIDQKWDMPSYPSDGSIAGNVVLLPGALPIVEHYLDNNYTVCRDWVVPVGELNDTIRTDLGYADTMWWTDDHFVYCCGYEEKSRGNKYR